MVIRGKLAYAVLAVLLGALGFTLTWSVWHVWQDHATFHQLVQLEIQQQQQRLMQQAPPAGGS